MQVSNDNTDQPIADADLHDALVDEREDIQESQTLPKCLVQTFHDSNPMQVSNDNTDQPISDGDLHDALVDEREDIEESQTLPRWLVQTLHFA